MAPGRVRESVRPFGLLGIVLVVFPFVLQCELQGQVGVPFLQFHPVCALQNRPQVLLGLFEYEVGNDVEESLFLVGG